MLLTLVIDMASREVLSSAIILGLENRCATQIIVCEVIIAKWFVY